MFAIIENGGKQYKIEPDKSVEIEKIKDIQPGEKVVFDKILILFDGKKTYIGQPYLKDFKIEGEVLEQKKSKKIIVFRYKNKTRYRKKKSQRKYTTKIAIKKTPSLK